MYINQIMVQIISVKENIQSIYFKLKSYQVINEFKDLKDNLEANNTAKANVVVKVKKEYFSNSVGNGPVNALDNALRSVLIKSYPILKKVNLIDYKVRILTPDEGTKAVTRVIIESLDENIKSFENLFLNEESSINTYFSKYKSYEMDYEINNNMV